MRSRGTTFQSRLIWLLALAAGVLAVPFLAMQFTKEIRWSLADFAIAAALLIGTGTIYLLGVDYIRKGPPRLAFATILLAALALIWIQLAAGIL